METFSKSKRKILQLASILVPVFFIENASAQAIKDTTLKEVKIHAKHKRSGDIRVNEFLPGQKVKAIDTATLQQYQLQSIANLLSQQEPVFVKSYGFNGLATLSFRGASAAQSEVLWNGVPIQNAALGVADVSALPVFMANKVDIVYGGSSALLGSGNVGGALLLENYAPFFVKDSTSLSVSLGGGSFNQFMGGFNASLCRRKWCFSVSAFAQYGIDNFKYTTQQGTRTLMPNDTMHNGTAMGRAAYKIADRNIISLSAWYQQDYRDIPPALFEPHSVQNQNDHSLRLLADWTKQADNNTWYVKSSFIRDEVDYNDNEILLNTHNTDYQYYQEIGWKKQFNHYGQLLLFSPVQVAWINVADSDKTKQQDKIALVLAYDYKQFNNKLDIAVNGRVEKIIEQGDTTTQSSIFIPGADASYMLTDWLALRANAQRTYREPTLNELYYNPGGNTGLKPEQGWGEDAGYTVKAKLNHFSIYHDLSVFNRDIHDWIIWLGGAIWTPHNIAEVHSRGVETENNLAYVIGKWTMHIGVNTSYVLSTTVASYIQNDGSIGKQIPYTPRYNGQLNIGFTYRSVSFNYNQTYTGYRFITTDESEYLLPYQTGNVQLMYNISLKGHAMQFTAQCNNIWNEQYQVVAFRPMPGVNWLAGFKVGIF